MVVRPPPLFSPYLTRVKHVRCPFQAAGIRGKSSERYRDFRTRIARFGLPKRHLSLPSDFLSVAEASDDERSGLRQPLARDVLSRFNCSWSPLTKHEGRVNHSVLHHALLTTSLAPRLRASNLGFTIVTDPIQLPYSLTKTFSGSPTLHIERSASVILSLARPIISPHPQTTICTAVTCILHGVLTQHCRRILDHQIKRARSTR